MEGPSVSIIVPVYNAHDTLHACIKSICSQTYRNIELILINDGSRDDSLSICQALAAGDERIRVIDKPNSGVSDTRNIGIEAARGTYIQFADSDDYLAEDAIRQLVSRAEETCADLVIAEFFRVSGKRIIVSSNIPGGQTLTQREFVRHMAESPLNFYFGVMWNKLYRRELLMQHGIRCCTELSWCEDFMFNMDYYARMATVATLDAPVYYYVKRKGSLANSYMSMTPARVYRMKRAMYEPYRELFDELELYEQQRGMMLRFFIDRARDGDVPPFAPQQADEARMQARRRSELKNKRLRRRADGRSLKYHIVRFISQTDDTE